MTPKFHCCFFTSSVRLGPAQKENKNKKNGCFFEILLGCRGFPMLIQMSPAAVKNLPVRMLWKTSNLLSYSNTSPMH